MPGSKRWPVTAWRELLTLALGILDEASQETGWTLGGGTALALKLHHRTSYDVDLFLDSASALHALSPNRNAAARAVAEHWQEPGNYIKLEREEGCIDFILAGCLTGLPPWTYDLAGRAIPVEQPAEIVAKKLKYRGSRLLSRDLFDELAHHFRSHLFQVQWRNVAVDAEIRRTPRLDVQVAGLELDHGLEKAIDLHERVAAWWVWKVIARYPTTCR